jgi:hypothetical protein
MVATYESTKRELGYNAARFLQMLSEQSEPEPGSAWLPVSMERAEAGGHH